MKKAVPLSILIIIFSALLLVSCGKSDEAELATLSAAKIAEVERFLAQGASGRLEADLDVTCPKKIDSGKDIEFTCSAQSIDSEPIPLIATQKDAKGNITWKMNARSTGAIETEIQDGVLAQKKLKVVVNCPDVIEFEKGATFSCSATRTNGVRSDVIVTQVDGEGGVTWSA